MRNKKCPKKRLVVEKWMETFIISEWKCCTILKDQIAFYLYNRISNLQAIHGLEPPAMADIELKKTFIFHGCGFLLLYHRYEPHHGLVWFDMV